jgi:hypothetical protein
VSAAKQRAYSHAYYRANLERCQTAARERYRAMVQAKPHRHHLCTACDSPGHNIRTCKACQRCGQAGEWNTSLGRLCQACLEAVA